MKKALIVEDNKLMGSLVKQAVEKRLGYDVSWVHSYAAATKLLPESGADFSVALLDVNLPDAPNGEIIDFVLARGVPVIVFTGGRGDMAQDHFWSRRIVDYVFKDGPDKLDYIVGLIKRLESNKLVKVLVVDDSGFSRDLICGLLRVHNYQIVEAGSGEEALALLENNRDIQMMITDYRMPGMDGFELVRLVRRRFSREQLSIIGISAQDNKKLPSQFIKNGANDFLTKPFMVEEFYCRVTQNIQTLEYIRTIQEISYRDHLTSLHNRRYFFDSSAYLFELAKRQQKPLTIAMIDIDHFKKVNDTYGHETGDVVLMEVAAVLKGRMRKSDIVARFGGEEFCVFAYDLNPAQAFEMFNGLRVTISRLRIKVGGQRIQVTVSIGLCIEIQSSLDQMIKTADDMLYQAKDNGRNRVVAQ